MAAPARFAGERLSLNARNFQRGRDALLILRQETAGGSPTRLVRDTTLVLECSTIKGSPAKWLSLSL
jgi:hypothetical protein